MIKKLKQTVRGFDDAPAMPTAIEFFNKINELCDAVNGMLYWHENLPRFWQNLSQKENTENAYTKTCRMDKEFAEEECKRLQNDLERTRKALDVAVDALKYANKCIKGGCVNWETEIDKALEQITALEQ